MAKIIVTAPITLIKTMTVNNRSEFVLLYDAQNANPNGNPLSANDMPRVDSDTQQAIVTDVRLKRYLRDQLEDDGFGIYIRNPQRKNEVAEGRDYLFEDLFGDSIDEILEDDDRNLFEEFLENATDTRYFGATLSFSEQVDERLDDEDDVSIPQYTGPLQFSHGRSLNRVVHNDESKKLSTVVTSGGDADQGTFAEDNRLEYALVRFHGVLNENAADSTNMTEEDVERLDSLFWRAIRNQTLTRSKMGHNPQLYLRVEFENGYHDGELHHTVSLDEDRSESDLEMRSVNDAVVSVKDLFDRLGEVNERVEQVVVKAGKYATFSAEGDEFGREEFYDRLEDEAGVDVTVPDVYDR